MSDQDLERWKRARRVFERLQDTPPERRDEALERASADDESLRRAVALLLDHDREDSFLEAPPAAFRTAAARVDPAARLLGSRLGPYRLQSLIGRGGSGIVYAAVREEAVEQRVAVKVLHLALHDESVARFDIERQILARLEHPNIARMIDSGASPEGLPYVAMELVEGLPITDYCDRHRLTIAARLELFRQVCDAVGYAHRGLIVHRDLKPTNILVAAGRVKLLDFGIAKLLEAPGAWETATLQRRLTPAYASPEQIVGGTITTASDIYSLGVLLFELLTGQRPWSDEPSVGTAITERSRLPLPSATFAAVDPTAAARAKARRAAPRQLARQLRGDLDAITARALRENAEDRYDGTAALLLDLERYRNLQPVTARRGESTYRIRRFFRRHLAGVSAVALILISTIAIALTSVRHAAALRRERDAAQEARLESETVAAATEDLLTLMNPLRGRGYEEPIRDVLERSAERIRTRFSEQPRIRARLLAALADVHASLQDEKAAEALLREALADRRRAPRATGAAAGAKELAALGRLAAFGGRLDEARVLLRASYALSSSSSAGEAHPGLVDSLAGLGLLAREEGDVESARAYCEQALAIYESLGLAWSPELARLQRLLASVYRRQGELAAASSLLESTLASTRAFDGGLSLLAGQVANDLATVRWFEGRYDEALALMQTAFDSIRSNLGEDNVQVHQVRGNIAAAFHQVGRLDEALAMLREAMSAGRRAFGEDDPWVAKLHNNLGILLRDMGRPQEALAELTRAVALCRAIYGDAHPETALSMANLGLVLLDLGRLQEAEENLQSAHEANRKLLGDEHQQTASTSLSLAKLSLRSGRHERALELAEEARRQYTKVLPASHWRHAVADGILGAALVRLGNLERGRVLLEDAYAGLVDAKGAGSTHVREVASELAALDER